MVYEQIYIGEMKIFEITFCGTCKLNCKSVTVDLKAGNMSKNVFKIVYDSFFYIHKNICTQNQTVKVCQSLTLHALLY